MSSDEETIKLNHKISKRKKIELCSSSSSSSSSYSSSSSSTSPISHKVREKLPVKKKHHKKLPNEKENHKKNEKHLSLTRESRSLSYSPIPYSRSKQNNSIREEKTSRKKPSEQRKQEHQSLKSKHKATLKERIPKKSAKNSSVKGKNIGNSPNDSESQNVKLTKISKKKEYTSSSKYNGYCSTSSSSSTLSSESNLSQSSVVRHHSSSSESDSSHQKIKKSRTEPVEEVNQSDIDTHNKHALESKIANDSNPDLPNSQDLTMLHSNNDDNLIQSKTSKTDIDKKRGQISIRINQLLKSGKRSSPLIQSDIPLSTNLNKNDVLETETISCSPSSKTNSPNTGQRQILSRLSKSASPVKRKSRSRSHSSSSRSYYRRSNSRSHSRTKSRSCSRHSSRSRSRSYSSRSRSHSRSHSRSPSIPRRRGSPSFLDKRRITSARKRPVPYRRPSPVTPSSLSSWSYRSWSTSRSPSSSRSHSLRRSYTRSQSWSSPERD
ncbi:serine/arginine repetitive matrix protein 4-like [Centruroides sculpturatus]|uniref:serine/arginine repetitive matrix protein 4-like n=1 Tax=Centruroides sculpturatus TaxID=218467 RepID=UPI000C6CB3BE|nr:serine/arginine repetitive matrix protein 4-like [Centruroides sculpturatus]